MRCEDRQQQPISSEGRESEGRDVTSHLGSDHESDVNVVGCQNSIDGASDR
jgi:hypothetical protein